MQEVIIPKEPSEGLKINELTIEDRQKLVNVFAWLIQEDKKQNPALYQIKRHKNND
jgi:uncharacterized protein YfaT (DUF1175 family)